MAMMAFPYREVFLIILSGDDSCGVQGAGVKSVIVGNSFRQAALAL